MTNSKDNLNYGIFTGLGRGKASSVNTKLAHLNDLGLLLMFSEIRVILLLIGSIYDGKTCCCRFSPGGPSTVNYNGSPFPFLS